MVQATQSPHSDTALTIHSLALIGLSINSGHAEAQFYLLLNYGGERDSPIMEEGKILLFKTPQMVKKWMRCNWGRSISWNNVAHRDASFVCNISEALRLVEGGTVDRSATIINCLNTFSDLLPASGFKLPTQYKRVLVKVADRLTFHREYGKFLRQERISRSVLRDAILWCLGSVLASSNFVEE